MRRSIASSVTLGVAAGLVWTHHGSLGLDQAWPLAVGFGLASFAGGRAGPVVAGTLVGIAASWVVFLVVTLAMPFIPASFGIAVGVAVGLLALLGAVWPRALSLGGMLIGFALFYGVYEPMWIESRTAYLGDTAAAASSLILAVAGGMFASKVISAALRTPPERRTIDLEPRVIRLEAEPAAETEPAAEADAPQRPGATPRGEIR